MLKMILYLFVQIQIFLIHTNSSLTYRCLIQNKEHRYSNYHHFLLDLTFKCNKFAIIEGCLKTMKIHYLHEINLSLLYRHLKNNYPKAQLSNQNINWNITTFENVRFVQLSVKNTYHKNKQKIALNLFNKRKFFDTFTDDIIKAKRDEVIFSSYTKFIIGVPVFTSTYEFFGQLYVDGKGWSSKGEDFIYKKIVYKVVSVNKNEYEIEFINTYDSNFKLIECRNLNSININEENIGILKKIKNVFESKHKDTDYSEKLRSFSKTLNTGNILKLDNEILAYLMPTFIDRWIIKPSVKKYTSNSCGVIVPIKYRNKCLVLTKNDIRIFEDSLCNELLDVRYCLGEYVEQLISLVNVEVYSKKEEIARNISNN